jgi:hypothetical protein
MPGVVCLVKKLIQGNYAMRAFIILITLFYTFSLQANVVEDYWGIVTDPLKIGAAGESAVEAVNRANKSLLALQSETDADIRHYLDSLSELLEELEEAIDRQSSVFISRVVDEINTFADRIDRSVNATIVQLECAAEVTLNDTLRRSLGGNIKYISRDKLEIVLPFKKPNTSFFSSLFSDEVDDIVEIDLSKSHNPFHVYEEIRDRHLQNIKYAKPDSRAKDLVLAYAEIARFARFSHCHYRNDSYGLLLSREYTHYDALVRPWVSTVHIKIESIN